MFSIRVTILGPNLCLLEDLVGEDVDALLQERKEWWELLFVSVKPWQPTDVDPERLLWLKIYGVPCHAWGESLFRSLLDSIGRYVKSDKETMLKLRMDEARICLRYRGRRKCMQPLKWLLMGYHSLFIWWRMLIVLEW